MKKRCILIGAVYGLVLLGWGITGTFSPAAPTRSEQSDNAVPVETIQLEQLCICPGNTFSVRTSQPLSASREWLGAFPAAAMAAVSAPQRKRYHHYPAGGAVCTAGAGSQYDQKE